MAYEVTATRRRPKTFDDLVGQEFVASTLRNSIKNGKIAHAYLFSGPRGCGKTSTARILAKVLNCEKGPELAPCGECTACKEIARGASMDVIEIDGASNTSVNDVRQIKDEVLFPPNSCKYKIYIIDEVHMLSTSAFNALLKTIEEPPPYVIFIFATTELHKVPATIKSRCQQFHFRLGSVEQIKDLLKKAADEVGIKADDEALYWIARESTGSFRDAYTLFDQVAAFSDGHITYEGIRDKLGLVGAERLNELCELCCDGNSGDALEKVDNLLQAGISVEQLITNMTNYLRSLLLIQSGITKEALLGQSKDRFSEKVLGTWDAIRLERAISLFLQLFRDLRYSLNPRYELELTISRLCWLKDYVSAREVKLAIDNARSLLAGAPAAQPTAVPAPQQPKMTAEQNYSEKPQEKPTFQFSFNKPVTPPAPQRPTGETNNPFPESGTIQNQVTEKTDIAANPELPLDELKAQIISETELSKTFLSISLKSTGEWYLSDDKVIIPVPNAYIKTQIDSENRTLALLTAKFKSPNLRVMTELAQPKEESKKDIPPEVENLCKLFNGEVVDVNTQAEQNVPETPQESEAIDFNTQTSQYYYDEEGDLDEF